MSEYIDKKALLDEICRDNCERSYDGTCYNCRTTETIADFPAADVQPVVRCKDCVWRGREECAMFYRCECGEQHTWETDNDFCSYGERKEHANEHQNPPGH